MWPIGYCVKYDVLTAQNGGYMNNSISFLLMSSLWIYGCCNSEKSNHQLNSVSSLSNSNKNETSMESYFPSPHVKVNIEGEILQALQFVISI